MITNNTIITYSSIRNWKHATGAQESARLLDIVPHLLSLLFADATAANGEVRETVFKGISFRFSMDY